MKVIDLTHDLREDMQVYPGTVPPVLQQEYTIVDNGFAETRLSFYSHTGTHIDAPAHMKVSAPFLNNLSADNYLGQGLVVNLTELHSAVITIQDLKQYKQGIASCDFLLLNTGWSKYWGQGRYLEGYPILDLTAVDWLLNFNLKGIGLDAISVDAVTVPELSVHHRLFAAGLLIIENLTNLEQIKSESFIFSCLPLKYEKSDGSPVRAVAILEVGD